MFQFKINLRNLRRGTTYSAINIGSLSIAMAAAILILAWIYYEWSYDRFHDKENQLYVVYNRATYDGKLQCGDWTPIPLGPMLKVNYPEIAGMARVRDSEMLYTNKESKLKINTGFTDPDFLNMFNFPLMYGNKEAALNDPYSVVLTKKAAMRLFGNDNPMGESLLVDNKHSLTVTGIMKDLPGNTMFGFEALVPAAFMKMQSWYEESWGNNSTQTFVELHSNVRLDLANGSMRDFIRTQTGDESEVEVFLYPLSKQHLYAKFENGVPVGGLVDVLRLFAVISGLILLIACINFMNLSTAQSGKRAKEVGVRKVMGGKRLSLIGLFLGESAITTLISAAIALIIALIFLPELSMLIGQQITLDFSNVWFWVAGLGFVLMTILLAGSYPAFYLSSFHPIKVLKGVVIKGNSFVSTRKVLVVVQFTVASALIVSTLVIQRQIKHAQDRESGYNKDQLLYVDIDGDIEKNYELIKHDLLNSGIATSVTRTMSPMSRGWANTWGVYWKGKDLDNRLGFDLYFTDSDWAKTTGTTIIDGRDIDIYTYPTDSTAMLLNESAVKAMNFENPIGEIVSTQGLDWHVVGVVKDFILRSPYEPVNPMVIGGSAGWFGVIHIKLNSNNRMENNLAKAEQIFKQFNPAYPFEYNFVDDEYTGKFSDEQKVGSIVTSFAGLIIFISCMGLFALVAYMAETRRKEIGVRKVLGATILNIMFLLSKEFLILVLISVVIASPVSWVIMNKWLANYAYRTDIPWWLFVVVGCICLSIALLTVGFQAIKTATANPVKAIKSE